MTPEHVKLEIAFRDAIAASDDDAALAAGLRILEALAVLERRLEDALRVAELRLTHVDDWRERSLEAERQQEESVHRVSFENAMYEVEQLRRQLAEKDEALRSILDVTTRWSAKMSLENQIALIDMLAREALRAEPAE